MNYFHVSKDEDFFDNPLPKPETYSYRPTVKGIVVDHENNIATLHTKGGTLLPGGGVEDGETNEEAFIRECMEEIGCEVEIIQSLGTAIQFRSRFAVAYEIHFFIAKVKGQKGTPTSTQESEKYIDVKWLPKDEVFERMRKQIRKPTKQEYAFSFNARTQLEALNRYLKQNPHR